MEYPDSNNQSHVRLLCVSGGSASLGGAIFFKDGEVLTSDSVTILAQAGDGKIEFRFTQEQEGVFQCQSNGRYSAAIGLAGKQYFCAVLNFHACGLHRRAGRGQWHDS